MGLEHVEDLVRPTTAREAWEEKKARGHEARFLAGGVDLSIYAPPAIEALIDLNALKMTYVRRGSDGIEIGATATMTEVLESPVASECADGLLVRVLRQVASPLQRNMATFGGTLGSAHPWSDVIPALLVLDAELLAYDGQEKRVALSEYLAGRSSGDAPLLLEIRIPEGQPRGTAFVKYARSGFDVAMLNCACALAEREGALVDVRVAVGGTPALASRLPGVETLLEGCPMDAVPIERIAEVVESEIQVRDDRRAGAAYRLDLAKVGTRRCVEEALERLTGGRR